MTAETTKRCQGCGRVLPLGEFARVRKDREWRRSKCNACESTRVATYRREARRG